MDPLKIPMPPEPSEPAAQPADLGDVNKVIPQAPELPAGMTDQEAIEADKVAFEKSINEKMQELMAVITGKKHGDKLKAELVQKIREILVKKGLDGNDPKDAPEIMRFMDSLPDQVRRILGLAESKLAPTINKLTQEDANTNQTGAASADPAGTSAPTIAS